MKLKTFNIDGYEKVVMATDEESGLKSIISIHNTNLGPAVGGTRVFPYASEEEALNDVLRLSKGMTYKSSLAGINFGGGKSVIIAKPEDKTPELLEKFAEFVNTFNGKYNCAEDVNTTVKDMEIIHKTTKYVMGLKNLGGDPSPITALGVFCSIKATIENKLNKKLNQSHIAIQGTGHVGKYLAEMLHNEGAKLSIADINKKSLEELSFKTGAKIISPEDIHTVECDIFSPCAMGAILNSKTIPELNCKAVVGAANNQLKEDNDANLLAEKGILYAPDYLVNAGGIINVFIEQSKDGYNKQKAEEATKNIANTLINIFNKAEKENILPSKAADKIAENRFMKAK